MKSQSLSLRRVLAAVVAAVAGLGVAACGALILLTALLHRTTVSASSAVESVRLAEEAEIELLLHDRGRDPLVRREIESNLRGRLVSARRFVTADDEAHLLREVERAVEVYFASSGDRERTARHLEDAYGALEQLVDLNTSFARTAQRQAARWDVLANWLGAGLGVLSVLVTGALLSWLRSRAFSPLLSLADTMARFGRGDREARAQERGATELKDMSRRFNEMATAIAAQREAQMAFLGGVAHDLRSPLAALEMSLVPLRPERALPDEARLRQLVARVDRQTARMKRMVGDFLDLARIEAGRLEIQLGRHDARAVVRNAVELFEGGGSGHLLRVSLPDHEVPLWCDSLRIEQVLANLISNAIKYSPSGTPVEVVLQEDGGEVVVAVTDHGMGISEIDKLRVFEPFRRVGLSQEAVPGVGLGLFIVKQIVDAHGGRIELISAQGRGSTFSVHLSLAERALRATYRGS